MLEQLLIDTYSQLSNVNNESSRSQVYFTIIQVKIDNIYLVDNNQTLYKDVKCFILSYIHGVKQEDYGYDVVEKKKINFAISSVSSKSAQLKLAEFYLSELKSCFYDDLVDDFKNDLNWYRLKMTLTKSGILKYWTAVLQFSGLNFWTISLTLIMVNSTIVLFLQDAAYPIFELYAFEFETFADNVFLNKFLNIFANTLGLAENFKIIPLNAYALIILILVKILYLVFIVNYLLEKIKDYTKL